MTRVRLAADHGGFVLKGEVATRCASRGTKSWTSAQTTWTPEMTTPDFIVPVARAVAAGQADRGVAICGSGVGAHLDDLESVAEMKKAG